MPPKSIRRIAALDLGSNSVKLLVVELSLKSVPRILFQKSAGTRLGEGIHHHFKLSNVAMERTLHAVHEFYRQCKKFDVAEWRAVATSAVRDAENRSDFEKRFQKRLGFSLIVLNGEKEAELIYRGVTSDTEMVGSSDKLVVMDSGGGSAEWIRGTKRRIEKRITLDLGCVRMTDRFLRGDPYTETSYQEMIAYYKEKLRLLQKPFAAKGRTLIGTGGSICTAAALDMALPSFRGSLVHGHLLSVTSLIALSKKLRHMTNEQRLKLPGMPQKRADIIVAGIALFAVALPILGARQITVSLRGLRYGLLESG